MANVFIAGLLSSWVKGAVGLIPGASVGPVGGEVPIDNYLTEGGANLVQENGDLLLLESA